QGRDCSSDCDDDVNLEPHELGPDLSEALAAAFRPAILDRDRAAFDPAQFAQSLDKRGDPKAPGRKRACTQESDSRQLSRLLRAGRERPRRRAAEQHDEISASYSDHLQARGIGTSCIKSVWDAPSQTLWIRHSFAASFDHFVGAGE